MPRKGKSGLLPQRGNKTVANNYQPSYNQRGYLLNEYPYQDTALPQYILATGDTALLEEYYANNSATLSDADRAHLEHRINSCRKIDMISESKHRSIENNVPEQEPPEAVLRQDGARVLPNIHLDRNQNARNGCWSCALHLMLQGRGVDLEQEEIRAYRPERTQAQGSLTADEPGGTMLHGHVTQQNTDTTVSPMDNPDLVTRVLPNTSVEEIHIDGIPLAMVRKYDQASSAFMELNADEKAKFEDAYRQNSEKLLRDAVKKGLFTERSPVAFSRAGHFVTIIGYNETTDEVIIKDSLNHAVEKTTKITDIVSDYLMGGAKDAYDGVSLFWLHDIKPGEPVAGHDSIRYNQYGELETKDDDPAYTKRGDGAMHGKLRGQEIETSVIMDTSALGFEVAYDGAPKGTPFRMGLSTAYVPKKLHMLGEPSLEFLARPADKVWTPTRPTKAERLDLDDGASVAFQAKLQAGLANLLTDAGVDLNAAEVNLSGRSKEYNRMLTAALRIYQGLGSSATLPKNKDFEALKQSCMSYMDDKEKVRATESGRQSFDRALNLLALAAEPGDPEAAEMVSIINAKRGVKDKNDKNYVSLKNYGVERLFGAPTAREYGKMLSEETSALRGRVAKVADPAEKQRLGKEAAYAALKLLTLRATKTPNDLVDLDALEQTTKQLSQNEELIRTMTSPLAKGNGEVQQKIISSYLATGKVPRVMTQEQVEREQREQQEQAARKQREQQEQAARKQREQQEQAARKQREPQEQEARKQQGQQKQEERKQQKQEARKQREPQEQTEREPQAEREQRLEALAKTPVRGDLTWRISRVLDYYSPQPKGDANERKSGVYTDEQLASLTPVNIQGIRIGEKPLTDEQFAALSFAATQDVNIGGAYEIKKGVQKLPENQRSRQRFLCDRVHYGMDFCQSTGGRKNAGLTLPTIVKDAREKTKAALTQYQSGNKAPLAKLIADGMHSVLNSTILHNGTVAETEISGENLGEAVMVSKLLPILNQDAGLKRAALDAGLTEQDIDHARGITKLHQTLAASNAAMQKLRDAAAGKAKLGATERKDCVDAALRGKILTKLAREHTVKRENDPAYQNKQNALESKLTAELMKPREQQDPNAANKFQQDVDMLQKEMFGLPEYLTKLGKLGPLYAQELAEKEVSRSALLKLNDGDLAKALDMRDKEFFQKPEFRVQKEKETSKGGLTL